MQCDGIEANNAMSMRVGIVTSAICVRVPAVRSFPKKCPPLLRFVVRNIIVLLSDCHGKTDRRVISTIRTISRSVLLFVCLHCIYLQHIILSFYCGGVFFFFFFKLLDDDTCTTVV